MPLASRATQARVARTTEQGDTNKPAEGESTQPRRPAANASRPAPDRAPPPAEPQASMGTSGAPAPPATDQNPGAGDERPPQQEARQRRQRSDAGKPRTTKPPATAKQSIESMSVADMKTRMRTIEVEYKELLRTQANENRELAAKHSEAQTALQREHAALARQMSTAVFKK